MGEIDKSMSKSGVVVSISDVKGVSVITPLSEERSCLRMDIYAGFSRSIETDVSR